MNWVLFLIYGGGMVLWYYLWGAARGFALMKKDRLLLIPFYLVFFILFSQIVIAFIYETTFSVMKNELALISIIETNTTQLLQSNVGVLIVAPVIVSIIKKNLNHDFIVFQAFSLIFVAGGVLPIYWTPENHGEFLYYLRHSKTVPYTIGIGFLIGGILILLKHLGLHMDHRSSKKNDVSHDESDKR